MRRGEIYKRRDKRGKEGKTYWIRWYAKGGKRQAESTHSDKHADAVRMLNQRLSEKDAGGRVNRQLKVDDGIKSVEADYVLNGRKSLDSMKRRWELHLRPYFGGQCMVGITSSDVRSYQKARMDAGASAGEINREASILRRAFTLAMKDGALTHKPHIPALREAAPRSGFFEHDQYESVLVQLPAHVQPVITFAYVTGWRCDSEVLPLQWRNVDLKAGEVRLDAGTTKNGEGRVFSLNATLRAVLDAQKASADQMKQRGVICPFVFHNDGERIRDFRKAWASATDAAGCPGRLVHDLRRTAVRNLVRSGTPEGVAMKMTGHKTRSVFERYNITSGSDLKAAAARLDSLFQQASQVAKKEA
jgi:integrase